MLVINIDIIVSIWNHMLSSWAFEPALDKSSAGCKTREQRPNTRFEVFRPWSRPLYQSTWRIWGSRLYSNRRSLLTALMNLALCYPISASTRWSSSKSTRYRLGLRIPDRSFSLTHQIIISNFGKSLWKFMKIPLLAVWCLYQTIWPGFYSDLFATKTYRRIGPFLRE